jgi:hypothetical protein
MRDQSEATAISAGPGQAAGGGQIAASSKQIMSISPVKQSLSKYCNEKTGPTSGASNSQNPPGGGNSSIQNVHQRLREYQGSHGKTTSVSKALFQNKESNDIAKQSSPPKLQSKTASAFGQSLRF